jgi:hypothetical protein
MHCLLSSYPFAGHPVPAPALACVFQSPHKANAVRYEFPCVTELNTIYSTKSSKNNIFAENIKSITDEKNK